MVLNKGDPKSIQIDVFQCQYKHTTLVSDYERFMLVKVQFMIVEAWLKVLIVLMSLLFVV